MAFVFHPFPLFPNFFIFFFWFTFARLLVRLKPSFPSKITMATSVLPTPPTLRRRKQKVVFVMGATGTGKSKLAIDLAIPFSGEIINSDKMQVYKGLDVVTNKVTSEERELVRHHLLGVVDPDAEFTALDFRHAATQAIEEVICRRKLPIVAGGSNSYIEALVDDPNGEFRSKYECCFLWVDVDMDVLHSFVSERVDKMVEAGLVEEVRGMFDPEADYTQGIRRAIGVPEMDGYFREEAEGDTGKRTRLLAEVIDQIKANTCKLSCCQLEKIHRLGRKFGWDIQRLVATEAFKASGKEVEAVWQRNVAGPASAIVRRFLGDCQYEEEKRELTGPTKIHQAPAPAPAPAAVVAELECLSTPNSIR